ncbi:MAG TPA: SLBB domain-containing protein [Candidatus Sulfotelmatobacter sp.]|jgi:protein involved in polysaccharide export with SLBB domain
MNSVKTAGLADIPIGGRNAVLCAWLFLGITCVSLSGQARERSSAAPPDLARQNLARVAGSPTQLIGILHKDPGLMVELKRWIARDAGNHGQLIADSDLTDEAIFDRLATDVEFRSVVTILVQKYGYLMPAMDPESALGKEQELLLQERVKWMAQHEEEDRALAHQEAVKQAGRGFACDPRINNCATQNTNSAAPPQPAGQQPEGSQGPVPGLQTLPVNPNAPYLPPQQTAPASNGTELLRTSGQDQNSPESLATGNLGGSSSGYTPSDDGGQYGSLAQRNGQSASQSGRFGTDGNPSVDGSLGAGSLNGGAQNEGSFNSDFADQLNSSQSNPFMNDGLYPAYGSTAAPRSDVPGYSAPGSALRARQWSGPGQRLVRSPNPYSDIPSLYDMYLQAAAHPPVVERFGMQVFENGTRDLQMIPMDLPAGPDYVVGSGDGVSVDLWGAVSRRFYRVVDREGRISLPEVGPIMVAGKSLADVQESVQRVLRTQFRDVSADVSLARLRTIRVYVVGDVLRAGAYDVGSLSTPLNALFAAGGPTNRGSLRIVKHYRGNQLVQDVDVYDLLLHGVKGDIQRLENGDTVMVPPLGPEITVEGMVRRPAIYEQKDEKSLADAIALAGGLLPTAALRHIEVQRLVAHEKQTMLSLDVSQDDSTDEATKRLESFQIQDGDKIRIFPIAPYTQNAIYLEGHVLRPGKYSFHDGMRVTDLISSYKDLLPEPAVQYGEIIRLSSPDFRPTVQSFNVGEALADPAKAPLLQALDTVQIFGRYDFENPPSVSVLGDVRVPGTYRTSGDIHLSDAIHLAGGLTPDAATIDAQVFRYLPDSTLKILNVKLDSALDGSPADNIVLSPRDRVLVHKNAAASDPPTVSVKGEVARPGRYPLTGEMRISDVIRAAGGLKQSADIQTADLTHYVWNDAKQVTANQEVITLADALHGEPEKDPALNNGDVLSIRQRPGWEDLGASVTIRGEVVHAGSYGIRPGERLSSVLRRAGGFAPGAYPYGTVLLRPDVQKLEQRSYGELIQRIRAQQSTLKLTATSVSDPDQKLSAESGLVQWQTALDNLASSPPTGRVTIQVSTNLKNWENTPRDVTMRGGDILIVPKRPSFVLVQGQVYGPTAVAYRPGRSAKWYLLQAGGPTNMANKRAIFVIRADGTVIGKGSSNWITGDGLSVALQPGDLIVVPEKALGGPPIWKTLFQNAQVLSSIATSIVLAAAY